MEGVTSSLTEFFSLPLRNTCNTNRPSAPIPRPSSLDKNIIFTRSYHPLYTVNLGDFQLYPIKLITRQHWRKSETRDKMHNLPQFKVIPSLQEKKKKSVQCLLHNPSAMSASHLRSVMHKWLWKQPYTK